VGKEIGGRTLDLEQYREYERRAAGQIEQNIQRLSRRPSFRRAKPEEKKKLLQKAVDTARAEARKDLLNDIEKGKL
jgi:hypothetical protein